MWNRLREWVRQIGRPHFDEPLDAARPDDRPIQRNLERKLEQVDRELRAIVANMAHTAERFDDR